MSEAKEQRQRSQLVGRLLDEHGAALALYAAQWTTVADDCVQEALIELARQSPLPNRPVAWLYRVVKNRALNSARGERRRANHERQAWQHRLQLLGEASDVNQFELADVLAQLSDADREVVVLKTWGRLSFVQIAEVTGESSSSAHRRYQQALNTIRQLWEVPCPNSTNLE